MFKVYVPALKRELEVAPAPSQEHLTAMILHGLKQKLTDAAAGKTEAEAEKAVLKRLETVWDISPNRGPKADPLWIEIRAIVVALVVKSGKAAKVVPPQSEFREWFESEAGITQEKQEAIRARAQAILTERDAAQAGLSL